MVQILKCDNSTDGNIIFTAYENNEEKAKLIFYTLTEEDVCVITNMSFSKMSKNGRLCAEFPEIVKAVVKTALNYAFNLSIESAYFSVDNDTLECLNECGLVNFNNKFIPSLSELLKNVKCKENVKNFL